ncbi:hypothetical protein K438DRAFT_1966265 [Mycena galopus ATCC 62051]|nr:hypothetical protein K438DRAFT_1966265 [Mycena galopus ATCC 62051]
MNRVQGPVSALTDYLRSTRITATTIARRVATQQQDYSRVENDVCCIAFFLHLESYELEQEGYASDNLDEPDSPPKKQKVSKAAAAKAKATKKKKDDHDSDEDAYTALSKSMYQSSTPKPAVGSFAECANCEKQFTVMRSLLVFLI